MAYMNKNAELKNGYNAYIDSSVDDMGTQMDVGLLLMEAGDTYVYEDAKKEVAILLFSGSVTYEWDGKKVEATALTASTTMPTACWPAAARR